MSYEKYINGHIELNNAMNGLSLHPPSSAILEESSGHALVVINIRMFKSCCTAPIVRPIKIEHIVKKGDRFSSIGNR